MDECRREGEALPVSSAANANTVEDGRKVELLAFIDGAEHRADVTDALVGGTDLDLARHNPVLPVRAKLERIGARQRGDWPASHQVDEDLERGVSWLAPLLFLPLRL